MNRPTLLSGTFKRGSSWTIGFTRKDSAGAPVDMTGLTTRAMFRVGGVNGDVKFTLDESDGIVIADPTTGVMSLQISRANSALFAATTTASPSATDTGTVYTNEGDADGATILLPTAVAGLQFTVYVQTAQTLTLTANSGDTIRIANSVTTAAGSITSNVVGSSVTLVAINSTEWVATSSVGSWSV